MYVPQQYTVLPVTNKWEWSHRSAFCVLEHLSHLYVCDSVLNNGKLPTDSENAVGSLLPPLCIRRLGSAVALETGKVVVDAGREQSFGCQGAHWRSWTRALPLYKWVSSEFRLQFQTLRIYGVILKNAMGNFCIYRNSIDLLKCLPKWRVLNWYSSNQCLISCTVCWWMFSTAVDEGNFTHRHVSPFTYSI